MAIEPVLERIRLLQKKGEITAWVKLEARSGEYAPLPEGLSNRVAEALRKKGIHRLYSHQAEAYDLARRGEHFVVVTPTASGKTLCYNLPIIDEMARDPDVRALYLFPTKALAQDQMAELHAMERLSGVSIGVHTYDGDTPADTRRKIRDKARIILTNPDMLHSGVLPHHPKWIELFQNLKYVVVDELHTYRGVFGSHVANVFRRLKRIAHFYNSKIQFIAASATIANPDDLASKLLEEEVVRLDRNGAPRAGKDLIFYNPPLVNPELGLRRSALASARRFAEDFLKNGVQTLVFTTTRVNVEVLLRYLQKAVHRHPGEPKKVRGYRSGYLPNTRREIERQLREKELMGVVSTNALELGIDIGSLEACILAGYPGTVASTWQQIGRAGRRTGRSAAILIARNLPLDQFIVKFPEYFLDRSPEHGLIHADNLQILVSHIKCAAFELPFEDGEEFGGETLPEILDFLNRQGMVMKTASSWHWTDESYPADSVSLRSIAEENFVVFNQADANRAIAEVDFSSAPELIHDDAIYMCEGRQYHVDRLDYDGRKAYVKPVDVDYYTEAITYSGLRVLGSDGCKSEGGAEVEHGEIHVFKKFPGFKKIKFYSRENLGYGKILLPVHELHTTAYWFTAPEEALLDLGLTRTQIIQGLLGLSHALHSVATLLVMCDSRDLSRTVGDRSAKWFASAGQDGVGFHSLAGEPQLAAMEGFENFDPTIFIYDNLPGGVGFSEMLFNCHGLALEQTGRVIQGCACTQGCPSCVGPVSETGEGTKSYSLRILQALTRGVAVVVQ